MFANRNIGLSLLLQLCLILICASTGKAGETQSVKIAHPAINGGKPLGYSLNRIKGPNGSPQEYYTDVDSVSCGEGVCDIVKVRIYWDALGGYLRYELPRGGRLTKKGHAAFTVADHEKLHLILSDPDSRLKSFKPETISSTALKEGYDVDVVTKPTPLFYKNSVVKGAVYTCYTLWHWANGHITGRIRELTARSCSYDHLMRYVNQGSAEFFLFATEQLAARGKFNDASASAIIKRANAGRAMFVQGALAYFESALKKGDVTVYCNAVLQIFEKGSSQKRTLCLRSLGETELEAPVAFCHSLAGFLPDLESYFELHLLLKWLDKHNPGSPETVKQVVKVLENDNFLIARRAYWYLKEQQLTDFQSQAVEAFEKKYEGRL